QCAYGVDADLPCGAGGVPAHVRLEELEAAARAVCEPYFTRPLAEISLGEVLGKLFRTARRYELTLQPQLILMQKTLLTIEGIGRLLDPKIGIWAVARPVLERILAERYSPQRLAAELRRRVPAVMTRAPEGPGCPGGGRRGWTSRRRAGTSCRCAGRPWRRSATRCAACSGGSWRRGWAWGC